jgi:hypothetical protein
MNASQILLSLFIGVLLGVFAWDRYNYYRARRVATSWTCFRCGVQLGPLQSSFIRVAGGPLFATSARACTRCAKRDAHLWWVGMGVVCVLFVATIVLLALR